VPTLTEETAEAICGALHRFDFHFLGDRPGTPLDSGPTSWWVAGRKPHWIRVAVIRAEPHVRVNVEWPVFAGARFVKGETVINIDTRGGRDKVMAATEAVVLKCLSIFRDVLGGEGVAHPKNAPGAPPVLRG
jgi:hypothetical protein